MKKIRYSILAVLSFACSVYAQAQQPTFTPITDSTNFEKKKTPNANLDSIAAASLYGWRVDPYSGQRIPVELKRETINFHQTSLVDGQGVAMGYLGNWGSPAQSKIFTERSDGSELFPFLTPYSYFYKRPQDRVFYNTKMPYSSVTYMSGGGRMVKEEQLKTEFTLNSGKKFNIGFSTDYTYARGYYAYSANKDFSYDIYSSYIDDRYQMHVTYGHNYFNQNENGGIANPKYITDPQSFDDLPNNWDSQSIPTRFENVWNRFKGNKFFMSHKYDIGYQKNVKKGDQTFIPVASFSLATEYEDQQRRFATKNQGDAVNSTTGATLPIGDVYTNSYYTFEAEDQMSFWSLKNTLAMTMNEGFRDWVKFGLSAYIQYDTRKFLLPMESALFPLAGEKHSQNATFIGGKLTKQKGKYLTYNVDANIGVVGENAGEFKLTADIASKVHIAGQDANIRAIGYVKNLTPTFFQENFFSKYIKWKEDFSNIRRVYAGGEIAIPHTGTKISGGVENIKNYIYYENIAEDASDMTKSKIDIKTKQEGKNIQMITLRLDQKLKAGIFHWDNQIVYQASSNKGVIPVPDLSFYSNIYLQTLISKVLTVQLGVDAHFHTKYYAPVYEPVTMQFYNQREEKIGGFPIATAYLNMKLKKARFFVMMYNIAESMGDSEYFSMSRYPVNPMTFKMGISVDFSN